jgi:DNA-binding NtrC family response regulator
MRRRHSILCVDADGFGLQVRRLVLETAGHRVFAFTRADEALRAMLNHQIDAVILDQALEDHHPGTARAFKGLLPEIPVLMLSTSLYPPASATKFINAYLTKGEAPECLLAEIEHVISKAGRHHNRIRPLLWASGAVATGAAWFAARALHRRMHRTTVVEMKKPPVSEKPVDTAKSARA